MKSLLIHYKNKYFKGEVRQGDDYLDVYDAEGRHCVALRKSGAGVMIDQSKELGCEHSHDLSPIPKDARLYKLVDGKLMKDDKFEARLKLVEKFMDDGKVLSCEELEKAGKFKFDAKQVVVE